MIKNIYSLEEVTEEEREHIGIPSTFANKLVCRNKEESTERVIAYFSVKTNEKGEKKVNVIETNKKNLQDNRIIKYYEDYLSK